MESYRMLETGDIERVDVNITVANTFNELLGENRNAATGKINGGERSPEQVQELAMAAEKRMVKVDPNAPSCCIDGRTCLHTLAGTSTGPRPSVAGGALLTAYAAAEMTSWFASDSGTTAERLTEIARALRDRDIEPGNHCDDNAVQNNFVNPETGKPATGCGADDRLPEIIQKPYDFPEAVTSLTNVLLGTYDTSVNVPSKDVISERVAGWNPTDAIDAIGNEAAIEVLDSDHANHAPNHGHRELGVVANYIENTTLDRDGFTSDTGEQLFVIDMWYIDKLANALATGPEATRQYEQLREAMVIYQVATYLVLCDGSQWALIGK